MEPFIRHTGIGVPLKQSNVDTDQIIPAVYLKRITRTGFDDALFANWRQDPDFLLNQDTYRTRNLTVNNETVPLPVTGDVYQVFMRGIATPQINVEIGVPLERAAAVVQELRDWYDRTNPHLHYPIILRATGPSRAWLSPSHGQDTLYFGFVVYYAEDGSLSTEGAEFLVEVEKLLAAHGGRPHWGKYFDPDLYDWAALYPRFEEFAAVRDALDPERVFLNAFTDRLFTRASVGAAA